MKKCFEIEFKVEYTFFAKIMKHGKKLDFYGNFSGKNWYINVSNFCRYWYDNGLKVFILLIQWWRWSNKKSIMEGKIGGERIFVYGCDTVCKYRARLMNISTDYAWGIHAEAFYSGLWIRNSTSFFIRPVFTRLRYLQTRGRLGNLTSAYLRWSNVDPHP